MIVLVLAWLMGIFYPPDLVASASEKLSLLVVGDVMLARSLTAQMRVKGDFNWPFMFVGPLIASADLVWVNLESPFGQQCLSTYEGMVFCADQQAVEGLVKTGIDLVSLANNHALDQGEAGLLFTKELLEGNYIRTTGLSETVIWEENGVRLGLLSFNAVIPHSDLIAWAEPEYVADQIIKIKTNVDAVVVYFHWGEEYTEKPVQGGGSQFSPRELAYAAIEAGAELVVGAHPHVVQPPEWYQGKLIVYSLGNFIFDQDWSWATRQGLAGRFIFDKEGMSMANFIPIEITNSVPRVRRALDNPWQHS